MWIINTLLSWLVDLICAAFEFLVDCFLNMFGMDGANTLDLFHYVFPFIDDVWTVCLWAGYFILFTITVWQVFKAMFGNLTEAESPTKTIAKMIITAGFVGFSGTLCKIFFYIGTVPFESLMGSWAMESPFSDFEDHFANGIGDSLMGEASSWLSTGVISLGLVSGLLPFIIIVAFSVLILPRKSSCQT